MEFDIVGIFEFKDNPIFVIYRKGIEPLQFSMKFMGRKYRIKGVYPEDYFFLFSKRFDRFWQFAVLFFEFRGIENLHPAIISDLSRISTP